MIDFLQGTLFSVEDEYIVIQVNGLGYQVYVPNFNLYQGKENQAVFIYTHHYIREDWMGLFGFQTKEERNLFRLLLSVSGIGPKVALAMMGQVQPAQVIQAIVSEDDKTLMKMQGVGKKTAQRIILDLKDKVKDFPIKGAMPVPEENSRIKSADIEKGDELKEALKSLGYHDQEIETAVKRLAEFIETGTPLEQLIKKSLQILMRE